MCGLRNMLDITAIVLGLSPTGLYAVRELVQMGHKVLGIGESRQAGSWSRYLHECISHDNPITRVQAIIDRFPDGSAPKPILIVTSDQDLDVVIDRAEELDGRVHLQGSYRDGLARKIMDKDSFYRLCDKHGVSYPKLWVVETGDAWELEEKITYPCMIKPSRIQDVKHLMGGQKGWILKTREDFSRVVQEIPSEAKTLIMQEIVPGPESSITLWCGYIDQSGSVRQRFTARKLRQYPPGFGSASLVQSHPEPESAVIAERLLLALGYRGIAAAEFKRDPNTGELKIIEVNPRPSLWFSISTSAGVSITGSAAADLLGSKVPDTVYQEDGIRWRYSVKDLLSNLFYRRTKDFVLGPPNIEVVGPAKAKVSAVFSKDDTKPALAEIFGFAAKGAARFAARLRGHQ